VDIKNDKSKIGVLIVDDSAFMRTAISRMIASDSGLRVLGTAADGSDALQKIIELDPDVVTLDVQMPGLDGLDTLRCIMARSPRPVIMVSSVTVNEAETTFAALGAGAFDYVPKALSEASLNILHIRDDLIAKIKAAAGSRRLREPIVLRRKPPTADLPPRPVPATASAIVALGISTGGPKALQQILPALPSDLAVPILVVQHMPSGFTNPFAQRLNNLCAASVREGAHGDSVTPGVIYIAPGGCHMTVQRSKNSLATISLSDKPEGMLHIPSVDLMMQSVAAAYGPLAMGVL
jgi:two-component system chemotaxis response regulator CheB